MKRKNYPSTAKCCGCKKDLPTKEMRFAISPLAQLYSDEKDEKDEKKDWWCDDCYYRAVEDV